MPFRDTTPANTSISSGAVTLLWDSVDSGVILPAASIVSAALDPTHKHLKVKCQLINSAVNNGGTGLRINGSAAANYWYNEFQAHASNILTSGDGALPDTSFLCGNAGSIPGSLEIDIPSYADSTGGVGKAIRSETSYLIALLAGNIFLQKSVGLWNVPNQPISTITLFSLGAGNWVAGTRISIYAFS